VGSFDDGSGPFLLFLLPTRVGGARSNLLLSSLGLSSFKKSLDSRNEKNEYLFLPSFGLCFVY